MQKQETSRTADRKTYNREYYRTHKDRAMQWRINTSKKLLREAGFIVIEPNTLAAMTPDQHAALFEMGVR